MANDDERLIVLVEARLTDLEKQMKRGSDVTTREFGKMRRSGKSAMDQMEQDVHRSTRRINQALAASSTKIGAYGKAFAGGLVGGIAAGGVMGIVTQITEVANGIARIGDEAKRAGVSAQVFQEWKFVAEQNRIGIDAMVDGLKELNLRADEFVVTGGGGAAEAFQRLGYSAADLKKKLEDPSALMLEIIDRLGQMDKAAQIRIADELFGGSAGERFVELLDQGEQGIRDTIDRAHELGAVMDDELIAKAADLDRRFNDIATTVGSGLKSAIVSAADSLAEFIDGFRDFEKQRSSSLAETSSGLGKRRLEVEAQMGDIREMQRNMVPDASGGYTWAKELGQWQAELDKIAADEGRIEGILTTRTEAMKRKAERTWTPPVSPPGGFGSTSKGSGGGKSRDKAATDAAREAEKVRELIAELDEELRLVGASDTQKEISNTLRRANVEATSKEGQQIAQLVTQIEAETAALEKQKEAQEARTEALSNMFEMGEDALTSIVDGSTKAEDAIKKLAVQMALAAAQGALLGTGPLAGLFGGGGGLFGGSTFTPTPNGFANMLGLPGHAKGTANTGGSRGDVRGLVHGQEAVIPLPQGGKVPVQIAGGGAAPQPMNFKFAPVYNVTGTGEDIAALKRQMQKDRAEFASRTIAVVRNAKSGRQL